ncbi:FAF protein [Spatholobus suberectus]|nr:FAF protein [Spatholobus suberectus]
MSACMSKKIQGQCLSKSQGIVTILGSNHEAATSLRRTLSADMSSKKWLSQNAMKKIASSEELSHSLTKSTDSSSSSEEDNSEETKQDGFQIWNTIQKEQPGQFEVWSSILSQKANEETSKSTTTPYVHPLVTRSKSCLSEKSLEICTEGLGSETGSDGFSSYPSSKTGDSEEEEEEEQEEEEEKVQITHEEGLQVPKYNYSPKKSLPRSFPPPLPSLHMRSHRDNGRLFLQAVSVPSQNNFCAQRENGRLVLTFADVEVPQEGEDEVVEFEEGDEAEEVESVIEQAPMLLSSGITRVHRLTLMIKNKSIGLGDANRNPKWSEKFNNVVNFKDVDVVQVQLSSLPPWPRARLIPSASGVFNACEYCWRTKPAAKAAPNNYSSLENNLKSCKGSRMSFLFWEPYCIAT